MTGTSFFLTEDDVRYLRGLEQRIAALEAQALAEVAPGVVVPYPAPARSAKWSDSRFDAISSYWNHWYQLNDFNSTSVADQTGEEAFDGILAADSEGALPLLGQIGGLISEGAYSIYFPGKEKSRISLPLLISTSRGWTMEALFKPEVVPQEAAIFNNGNDATNGFGIGIGNGSEGKSGSKLIFRSPAGNIDTGITLIADQWYDVIFVSNASDNKLYWYVATITPLTKEFSITTGSAAQAASIPTAAATIGCQGASGALAFKGWVDEVLTLDSELKSTETSESVYDRLRTGLEPATPFGFVKADGIAVSRSKYARIFAHYGVINGVGDGLTTFDLPDYTSVEPGGLWIIKT